MSQHTHVTVGRISKEAGVLPSTVRYYLKQGLLSTVGRTTGGFFLFDFMSTVQRIQHIRHLQQQERLTIEEIRHRLDLEEHPDAVLNEQTQNTEVNL